MIASWLLDLTAAALVEDPLLANFAGRVSDSGEGRWTIKAAIDEAVPVPVLTTALYTLHLARRGGFPRQIALRHAIRVWRTPEENCREVTAKGSHGRSGNEETQGEGAMKVDVALPYMFSPAQARVADYVQLVRPRLALLVLVTVGVGWLLRGKEPGLLPLAHALTGTALLFAGASALNQLVERHRDALMARTANRPLPAGRLKPGEVLAFGGILSASGLLDLLAFRQPLAAGLGAFAFFSYVLVYTPLKERTPLSTLIGAVPGACRR